MQATLHAIDPHDLARVANRSRRDRSAGRLAVGALTRWLLAEGLAVEQGGLLMPTERGLQLGELLR